MKLKAYKKYMLKAPGEESRTVTYLRRLRKGIHRVIDERHPGSVYRQVKREWIHELEAGQK